MSYRLQCPGSGPVPSSVFLCGEKPGLEEIRQRKPFIGRSGDEQNDYLRRYHLSTRTFYLTNLIKHYIGDRNPTDDEIAYWSPYLQDEIERCNPQLIIAVGAVSTRYFLGREAALETCHGIPHRPGAFDVNCAYRAPFDSIILPIYHPALGFKDSDARSLIAWDYKQVADAIVRQREGKEIEVRYDKYAGKERYADISGTEMEERLEDDFDLESNEFAIDTEGTLSDRFSFQVSYREGEGYMVRTDRKDFMRALRAIGKLALTRDEKKYRDYAQVIGHNLMHDIAIIRAMGQELRRAPRLFDTMYAAYITRIESYSDDPKGRSRGKQGLKPLAWRHNGTRMLSWEDVTSEIALRDRIAYLERVVEGAWPVPKLRAEQEHNGTWSIKKRKPVQVLAAGILRDWYSEKLDKDGQRTDIEGRWFDILDYVREPAEKELGPLPNGSVRRLFDENPQKAIFYAVGDSDQTLRLKHKLEAELQERNLTRLMRKGMAVLPMFEEMQSNGFTASRSYFESLSSQMWDEMMEIGGQISKLYFGRPFNPESPKQTAELLEMRGLTPEKMTKTGAVSTAKKSIEHFRFTDPAIEKLFEFREREHIRDSFSEVILRSLNRDSRNNPDSDIGRVYSQILITRTATRRPAAKNPNLLNIPVRTKLGLLVRKGFCALPGMVLLAGDLSQIEYRILASFSGDKTLLKLFNTVPRPGEEKPDIHKQTASWVLGKPLHDVTKQWRDVAKTVNYGKVYLQTGMGMADTLRKQGLTEWTPDRCDELIRETDKLYPGVPQWVQQVIAETYETEMSSTYEGMPRYLPGIRSRDRATRSEAERHAVSQRIQGTAQDMLQNSMIWLTPQLWKLQDRGEQVEPLLQVYDELILMTEPDMVGPVSTLLHHALVKEGGVNMRVPIEAEIHSGERWSELK